MSRLLDLRKAAITRLEDLRATPEPTLALYRSRYRQKLSKELGNIRNIEEAIKAEESA